MTWENPLTAHCSGFRTMQDNLSYIIPAPEIRGKIPQDLKGIFFPAVLRATNSQVSRSATGLMAMGA